MSEKMHADAKLGEVRLKVSELDRSIRFYEQSIGFRLLRRSGSVAEMTADGEHALVILEEVPDAYIVPERTMSGLYHYAILVPTREHLAVIFRHLIQARIPIGQADHYVSEALYLSDPDGNGIEIYRDRPREEWRHTEAGEVEMATLPIDAEGLLKLSQGHVWQGMPAGTTIGHVHFHVNNMMKSCEFYCNVLGFTVEADMRRRMGAMFIAAGGYHHHIGLNVWAGVDAPIPPPNSTGIAYFTIELPHQAALEQVKHRLVEAGSELEERDRAIFTKDPNGIGIQLLALSQL